LQARQTFCLTALLRGVFSGGFLMAPKAGTG
jgi:hypothetical protein